MNQKTQLTTLIGAAAGLSMLAATPAYAGTITAEGNVTALTDYNDMASIDGTAVWDGPNFQQVPLNQYQGEGMMLHTGPLVNVLNGVNTPGNGSQPLYVDSVNQYFPMPIQGNATAEGQHNYFAGIATFTNTVTQFGLTASRNGTQYLTVWDENGTMLGQVRWQPAADSAFVGVDTGGVPIGMVAYGNDDLWNGGTYGIGGATIMSDNWVWSEGPCMDDSDCDDGDMCNGAEVCNAGVCEAAPEPLDCDDQNVCTDDSCDPQNGCVNDPNMEPCDDGDMCTQTDICEAGECIGSEPLDCDDAEVCSMDSCDPLLGCVNDPIDGCCDDDSDCIDGEEFCDIDNNICEMVDNSSTGIGPGTTGTTGTTTDGSTTDDSTSTTEGPTGSSSGESDSNTGPTAGETDPTTTTGDPTVDPTTSGGGSFTSTDSDSGAAEDGCGCNQREGDGGPALLGLFVLGLALRRRS